MLNMFNLSMFHYCLWNKNVKTSGVGGNQKHNVNACGRASSNLFAPWALDPWKEDAEQVRESEPVSSIAPWFLLLVPALTFPHNAL